MIIANLQDSARIESLHPAFKQLFDYLKSHDMLNEPMGKTELDGKVLYINNDEPTLRTKEAQAMEVHKDYIDVHIPLNGVEIIGWKATRNCTDLKQPPHNLLRGIAGRILHLLPRRCPCPHHRRGQAPQSSCQSTVVRDSLPFSTQTRMYQ